MIIVFVLIDISNRLDKRKRNAPFVEQISAYKKIEDYIMEHGAQNAVLIQVFGRFNIPESSPPLKEGDVIFSCEPKVYENVKFSFDVMLEIPRPSRASLCFQFSTRRRTALTT